VPARVAGTVVCSGVGGTVVDGGGGVAVGVGLVMFIDGAGREVESSFSGLRV
jgi:hypothetical protein